MSEITLDEGLHLALLLVGIIGGIIGVISVYRVSGAAAAFFKLRELLEQIGVFGEDLQRALDEKPETTIEGQVKEGVARLKTLRKGKLKKDEEEVAAEVLRVKLKNGSMQIDAGAHLEEVIR